MEKPTSFIFEFSQLLHMVQLNSEETQKKIHLSFTK